MSLGFTAVAYFLRDFVEEAMKFAHFVGYTLTTCPPPVMIQNCVFLTMFVASCKILLTSSHHRCLASSKEPELLKSVHADSVRETQIFESSLPDCSKNDANISVSLSAILVDETNKKKKRKALKTASCTPPILRSKRSTAKSGTLETRGPHLANVHFVFFLIISGWAIIDDDGNEIDLYGSIIRKAIPEAES
ncbi:hypothetical protein B0H13DRAFT_1850256 [Mycena leptocephala]|nr:hypothetical protein B0H13DRAFT_1850256 [Mycena leptocephala]